MLLVPCNSNQESNSYLTYSDTAKWNASTTPKKKVVRTDDVNDITTGNIGWVIPDSVYALLTKSANYSRKQIKNELKFDETKDEKYARLADKYGDSAHYFSELFDRSEKQFRVKIQSPVPAIRIERKVKAKKHTKAKKYKNIN